jgi:hypothetical protein
MACIHAIVVAGVVRERDRDVRDRASKFVIFRVSATRAVYMCNVTYIHCNAQIQEDWR